MKSPKCVPQCVPSAVDCSLEASFSAILPLVNDHGAYYPNKHPKFYPTYDQTSPTHAVFPIDSPYIPSMTVIQHNTTYIIQYRFTFSCLCLLSFHHPKYSSIIPSFSKYSLFTVFLHPQLISFKNHHFCWNMLFGLLFNSHPALSPLASSHPSAPQAGTNSGASARREAAVAPAPAAPLALAPAFACVIDHDAFTSQIGIWNCQANKQIWVYRWLWTFRIV